MLLRQDMRGASIYIPSIEALSWHRILHGHLDFEIRVSRDGQSMFFLSGSAA